MPPVARYHPGMSVDVSAAMPFGDGVPELMVTAMVLGCIAFVALLVRTLRSTARRVDKTEAELKQHNKDEP